jgi:hypothetical protein
MVSSPASALIVAPERKCPISGPLTVRFILPELNTVVDHHIYHPVGPALYFSNWDKTRWKQVCYPVARIAR